MEGASITPTFGQITESHNEKDSMDPSTIAGQIHQKFSISSPGTSIPSYITDDVKAAAENRAKAMH